jgi:uncharacterized protein (DUF58 family)
VSGPAGGLNRRGHRRAIQAVLVGVAAGMVGVALSRVLFGPETAPIGIAIGATALVGGTLLSWRLHRLRRPADSLSVPRGLHLRRRAHPVAWIGSVAGSLITMVAWAGVAHSSGSGWVQSVGALLGAFLLVGLLAPGVPAARAMLHCTVSPSDARAGEPFQLTIEVDRPIRLRPVHPVGSEHQAGGHQRGTRTVTLGCTPARRGVLDAMVVEVASSAPFGLLWWARDIELVLPRPLHVAPRVGGNDGPTTTTSDAIGEAMQRVPSGIGEPRGVRPYSPGDPRHAVHWPATAHAGTLMVRESERQTDEPIVVELVLSQDPAAAENEAEHMMATVGDFLARQRPVVLITSEPGGRVVRLVSDPVDLGRRLARAVPV